MPKNSANMPACSSSNRRFKQSRVQEGFFMSSRNYKLILMVILAMAMTGCFRNKKVVNPIANVNSKQPDKVLFDRAMEAMKHNKFDVARLSLQTLINTYPDSEYIARAKLAVADSWYAEGGSA